MSIKRIGVLTSGGDAPGMNAAVRAVVRTALSCGIECIGIRRGWQGLINADFLKLDSSSVGHILSRGGTILFTARSEDFMTEKGRERAVMTCKMLGLDGIVAIGGDGTFRGALELSRLGVPVVGIPATIDNDLGCSNYTIGFDTACNTAIDCIDKLRDTMQSHERCSVVEVMGRNAGFLALYVGIAVGATAVLIPEHEVDFQKNVIEAVNRIVPPRDRICPTLELSSFRKSALSRVLRSWGISSVAGRRMRVTVRSRPVWVTMPRWLSQKDAATASSVQRKATLLKSRSKKRSP